MSTAQTELNSNLGIMLKNRCTVLYTLTAGEVLELNRIKELRLSKGLYQKDLAELLKCNATAVSKYELGQLGLDAVLICRLCDIFECSADYLLGRSVLPSTDLSGAEAELLLAYRAADQRAKDMVDLALEPFKATKKSEAV